MPASPPNVLPRILLDEALAFSFLNQKKNKNNYSLVFYAIFKSQSDLAKL